MSLCSGGEEDMLMQPDYRIQCSLTDLLYKKLRDLLDIRLW
jgi:hypothetical protein